MNTDRKLTLTLRLGQRLFVSAGGRTAVVRVVERHKGAGVSRQFKLLIDAPAGIDFLRDGAREDEPRWG